MRRRLEPVVGGAESAMARGEFGERTEEAAAVETGCDAVNKYQLAIPELASL